MSPNLNKKKRTANRTSFKKGVSGNPGGRPRMPVDVREAFKEITVDARRVLHEILQDVGHDGSTRVAAAREILNRAWGTPTQMVEHSGAMSLTHDFWGYTSMREGCAT